jgi:hypothetical protein
MHQPLLLSRCLSTSQLRIPFSSICGINIIRFRTRHPVRTRELPCEDVRKEEAGWIVVKLHRVREELQLREVDTESDDIVRTCGFCWQISEQVPHVWHVVINIMRTVMSRGRGSAGGGGVRRKGRER